MGNALTTCCFLGQQADDDEAADGLGMMVSPSGRGYSGTGVHDSRRLTEDSVIETPTTWQQVMGGGHGDLITAVALCKDLSPQVRLASTSLDQSIKVQSPLAQDASSTFTKSFDTSLLNSAWLSADALAVGTRSGDVVRLIAGHASLSDAHTMGSHQLGVTGMAAFGGYLCTGSRDGEVKFWDLATLVNTASLKVHRNVVTAIAPMGPNLFCQSSEDKSLRVWDVRTGSVAVQFPKQQYILTSCAVAGGGRDNAHLIVTGSSGGGNQMQGALLTLWDIRTSGKVQDFRGHESGISDCSFINERLFVSCSKDSTVRLWGVDAQSALDTMYLERAPTCCDTTRDGLLAFGNTKGDLFTAHVDTASPGFLAT
ncbi:hypothetical protein PTSG_04450 [Salpingoeca rosetta]|uniref:Uncharacterized protein n=1 Tax=Salpingoeca rosetta (strain ATCC 50818 / BSB-021) TaxID=946362 RepID=F2U8L4_SALR5|nr:uncharacterized protein PTSG_04450 [Salpingoeca rosetta]EGD72722.1 hypothetical protein PTSG_04450 [Salpingoeca rosetta]|eukprot:XP_004994545.1 hypothetical protein PTSG_04450 [Salpingoeca rosetta]